MANINLLNLQNSLNVNNVDVKYLNKIIKQDYFF